MPPQLLQERRGMRTFSDLDDTIHKEKQEEIIKQSEIDEKAARKALEKRVKVLLKEPSNKICSECRSHKPKWISLIKTPIANETVGVFCCQDCSEHFLMLNRNNRDNHNNCTIRSTLKSLKKPELWTESDVQTLENTSNQTVNAIYEPKSDNSKPAQQTSVGVVIIKYTQCLHFTPENYYKQLQIRKDKRQGKDEPAAKSKSTSVKDLLQKALQKQQILTTRVSKEKLEVQQQPTFNMPDLDIDEDSEPEEYGEPKPTKSSSLLHLGSSRHSKQSATEDETDDSPKEEEEKPQPQRPQRPQRRRSTIRRTSSLCVPDRKGGENTDSEDEPTPRQRRVSRFGGRRTPTRGSLIRSTSGTDCPQPKLTDHFPEQEPPQEGHNSDAASPSGAPKRVRRGPPRRSRTMDDNTTSRQKVRARDRTASRQSLQGFVAVLKSANGVAPQPEVQKALAEIEQKAEGGNGATRTAPRPLSSRERASRLGRMPLRSNDNGIRRTKSRDSSTTPSAELLGLDNHNNNRAEMRRKSNDEQRMILSSLGKWKQQRRGSVAAAAAAASSTTDSTDGKQQPTTESSNTADPKPQPRKEASRQVARTKSSCKEDNSHRASRPSRGRRSTLSKSSSHHEQEQGKQQEATSKEEEAARERSASVDDNAEPRPSSVGRQPEKSPPRTSPKEGGDSNRSGNRARGGRSSMSKSAYDGTGPFSARRQGRRSQLHKSMSASDFGHTSRRSLLLSEDNDTDEPTKSHQRRPGHNQPSLHKSMSASEYGYSSSRRRSSLMVGEQEEPARLSSKPQRHRKGLRRSMSSSEYDAGTSTRRGGRKTSSIERPKGCRRTSSLERPKGDRRTSSLERPKGGRRNSSLERPKVSSSGATEQPTTGEPTSLPSDEIKGPSDHKRKAQDKRHSSRRQSIGNRRSLVESNESSHHKRGLKALEDNMNGSSHNRSSHKRGQKVQGDNGSNKNNESSHHQRGLKGQEDSFNGSSHNRSSHTRGQEAQEDNGSNKAHERTVKEVPDENGSSHDKTGNVSQEKPTVEKEASTEESGWSHGSKQQIKEEDGNISPIDGSGEAKPRKPQERPSRQSLCRSMSERSDYGSSARRSGRRTSSLERPKRTESTSRERGEIPLQEISSSPAIHKRREIPLDATPRKEEDDDELEVEDNGKSLRNLIMGNLMSTSAHQRQVPETAESEGEKPISGAKESKSSLACLENKHGRPDLRRCNSESTMLSSQCIAPRVEKSSMLGVQPQDEIQGDPLAKDSQDTLRDQLQRSASDRGLAQTHIKTARTQRFLSAVAASRDLRAKQRESEDTIAANSEAPESQNLNESSHHSRAGISDLLCQSQRRSMRRLRGHLAASGMIEWQKPADPVDRPNEMKRNNLRNSLRCLAVDLPRDSDRSDKGAASEEKQSNNSTEEETKRRPVCTFIYR